MILHPASLSSCNRGNATDSATENATSTATAISGHLASLILCATVGSWLLSPPTASTMPLNTPLSEIASAHASTTSHQQPVPGIILSPAEIPPQRWLPGHRGVDLDANPGDPIRASATGVIYFAGSVAGTPSLSIEHGRGLRTTYEPVVTHMKAGDRVTQGTVIGVLADASTLPETARHERGLHWGAIIRKETEDQYIDPMMLLTIRKVRLWL